MIPETAVEAAAKRVYGAVTGNAWAVADDTEKAAAIVRARWILEAAAPHLMAQKIETAVRAVLSLHCIAPKEEDDLIGPYCAECVSPIDGGPELYPCLTVKTVLDACAGRVVD